MIQAMGRTDSEIHSFSHWAIMTLARRGQTVSYIHSPIELSWPWPRRGQTVRFIRSLTELSQLSYHDPGHWEDRQWATFILSLSYHDPGQERTDSELHSLSHWAIMTLATERTDSEIHSFSHWAITTELSWPGSLRGQTVRFIRSLTELSQLSWG